MNRNGVTLLETTVALLILAVGVVTVATLFPISLSRSIHATQLTHATILRHNAESQVNVSPQIIFDPDGDWDPGDPTTDGGVHEHASISGFGTSEPNYLIDPIGAVIAGNPRFGSIPRYSLGASGLAAAQQFTSLETWDTIGEDIPQAVSLGTQTAPNDPQSATLTTDSTIDLTTVNSAVVAGVNVRAVIFDSTGRASETRQLSPGSVVGQRITWSPPLNNARFYTRGVSKIAIETRTYDYTWLMAVQNTSSTQGSRSSWILNAGVEVAIFFRRSVGPDDEQVFTTNGPLTISGADPRYTIRWTGMKPAIKKGGFVLDVKNAHWCRIERVESESDTSAVIVIDRNRNEPIQEAAFMRGIIDVFPIGKKEMEVN